MPLTTQVNGTLNGGQPNQARASWWNDYKDALTGVMTDQAITLNYRPGSNTGLGTLLLKTDGTNALLKAFKSDNTTNAALLDANGNLTLGGSLTVASLHGNADTASGVLSDNGYTLAGHVTGTAPTQFYLLETPQSAGNAMSFGARVFDGSATHDVVIVNANGTLNGSVKVSYFSGTGSGSFSHGLGQTPSWVGITDSQSGSSMTVGATAYGSSTVTINTGASHTWKGIAIA